VVKNGTVRASDMQVHTNSKAAVLEFDPGVIRRAKAGDERAFGTLVDQYHARCVRFAQQMLLSVEDAEEAVQDAFVRVYDALPRFDEKLRFEPWLFRILANRCRTMRMRRRRHDAVIVFTESAPDMAVSADGEDRARDDLWALLEALPVEQREAFLLHHVEGMGYDDMASVTGIGVSALKMRVKRACDVLRARMLEANRA
jgi:RNA polymerase sigma-70 factor (ECF subfamily)